MKWLFYLLIILTIISCGKKEYTKADLSFKLISMASLYGSNEDGIQKFEKIIDSIRSDPNANKKDIDLCDFFARLKKNGLYTSPYIHLQIEADSLLIVYLDEIEYEKVKEFDHKDLVSRNKKIELQLDIEKKDEGIFFANEIIGLKEVNGETIVAK